MKSPCNVFITVLTLLLCSFQVSTTTAQTPATQARVLSTPMTGFGVPFKINDPDGRFIEVHLYVSKDRGQTWQYHDRTSPQETQFPFRVQRDGEYWFALKTLDRDRHLNPDGEPQPELKVIVDTRKPTLDLTVKSDPAGRLVCKWRAEDRFIDPSSLRISYKSVSNGASQWTPIEYRPLQIHSTGNVFADQLAWWPEVADQQIQVRLTVNDRAGNTVSNLRTVYVPRVTNNTTNVAITNRIPQNPPNANSPLPNPRQQVAQHVSQPQLDCSGGVCRLRQAPANPPHPGPVGPAGPATNNRNHLAMRQVGSAPEFAAPPRPIGLPNLDIITASAEKNVSLTPDSAARNPNRSTANRSPQAISWNSHEVPTRGDRKQIVSSTGRQGGNLFDRDDAESEQVVATATTTEPRNPFALGDEINRQTSGENQRPPITPRAGQPAPQLAEDFLVPSRSLRNASQPLPERDLTTPTRPLPSASDFSRGLPPSSTRPRPKAPANRDLVSRESGSNMNSINSRRFLLNYNVDAIDPSGVGKVVLWVTRNGGETWSSMATDNDNKSPFPVQVDDDGEFGFRVVIHSKDGLVGRPPSRGDEADMWVRIDTQAPTGKIISVPYGTGNNVGRLVVNWRADDERLRTKPIDLAYSNTADGPWTIIQQGIRNTGTYAWKVERDIPDRIFLRLKIHDAAGNITVQKLTQPIDISGLVPRGRINSIQAITTQ